MLSIIVPFANSPQCLESLYTFTLDPDFEVIAGEIGRFGCRHIETQGYSYVQAANVAAAAARGNELVFVRPDILATFPQWRSSCFGVPTSLFRRVGGFNEHFRECCHDVDLCRRLNLPEPPLIAAQNRIDQLLLDDLWPTW